MEPYDVIVNQPVVIDNGSGVIKAGFAGDQVPKCCFPNYIGRPKHIRVMAGALEGDIFVGPKAEEHRGLLSIHYPMEHGIITDWNDMERIWQYVYRFVFFSHYNNKSKWHLFHLSSARQNHRSCARLGGWCHPCSSHLRGFRHATLDHEE
uniref:Alpha-centractin n=1 Tax=Cacopsylla melanoneura TaxID=428564 RepID=A0A8D8LE28_9HEMI